MALPDAVQYSTKDVLQITFVYDNNGGAVDLTNATLVGIIERDGVDAATALFSESTGRVIVSVPREDDVRFLGLCEARNYPVLRIGVTDLGGEDAKLDVQGLFEVSVNEIRQRSNETLPKYFG